MAGKIQEKLRRVERILTEEEPVTQKQAVLLNLDLFAEFWGEIEEPIKMVKDHQDRLTNLEARVKVGIGLTVLIGVAGGVSLFF